MPVRVRRDDRPIHQGQELVRGHSQRMLRKEVRGEDRQRRPDHRAAHDMHLVRGGLRGSHDWELSRRGYRRTVVDDAHWDCAHSFRYDFTRAKKLMEYGSTKTISHYLP